MSYFNFNAQNGQVNFVSPWSDPSLDNLFRTEIEYAKLDLDESPAKVNPFFKFILKNRCADLLFKALDYFAPLVPLGDGRCAPPIFLSPPLSGIGNQVRIVIGKDALGKMRIVGGNGLHDLDASSNSGEIPEEDFFFLFDSMGEGEKRSLIDKAISGSMTAKDLNIAVGVKAECRRFRTVPVSITIVDGFSMYFCVSPALVYGKRSSNHNLRFFGEVL
jgi:hypothetical protein